MAAARDQAARIVRETANDEAAPEAGAQLADQLRTHVTDETRRRPVEPPSGPASEKPAAAAADAVAAKPAKRKFIMIGVLGLLALAAIGYGVYFVLVGRFYVSTDDAYVRANNTTLGARVSGHVAAILPRDNSIVRADDVIFRIDDGDYRIAVDAARSKIATQQATIDRIGRQVTALESATEQAKAQLASADAALKRAGLDFDRQQTLSTKGFASRAVQNLAALRTVLLAKGMNGVWCGCNHWFIFSFIDANYKETQLKRIRPGQPVKISVDAYGHRKFAGIVDSISPAAGSVFTLLPPDNATGNFTKIVQRLPVRIRVPKDVAKQNLLRAGMSVYITVDTREGAADADSEADLDAPGTVQPQ